MSYVAERIAGDRTHVDTESVPQELEVPVMVYGGELKCPALFLFLMRLTLLEDAFVVSPVPGRKFRGTVEGGALDMHLCVNHIAYVCAMPISVQDPCLPSGEI
jgi:hypothetical protein